MQHSGVLMRAGDVKLSHSSQNFEGFRRLESHLFLLGGWCKANGMALNENLCHLVGGHPSLSIIIYMESLWNRFRRLMILV